MLLKQYLSNTVKVAAMATVLLFSSLSIAEEITAADYVAMDLQTRQMTLEGVKDRLVLLQSGSTLATQLESDAQTQQQVSEVYQAYGITSSKAIAWATQHSQAITQWLNAHPDQQAEYDRIAK